jgi:hypothetical protein
MAQSDSLELAKHLWEVWHYRHGFLWGALVRWGLAVLFVSVIPHLQPQFLLLGKWILVFPITSFLLTVVSFIHLLGEHQRLIEATRRYISIAGTLVPDPSSHLPPTREPAYTFATGVGVIIMYLLALTLLSIANGIYLVSAPAQEIGKALLKSAG